MRPAWVPRRGGVETRDRTPHEGGREALAQGLDERGPGLRDAPTEHDHLGIDEQREGRQARREGVQALGPHARGDRVGVDAGDDGRGIGVSTSISSPTSALAAA